MHSQDSEKLEIVDGKGNVIGLAERSQLHRNPGLIHRVVHILVFNKKGELLLQKRSQKKDIAPGKWDTSVGGHVNPGEDVLVAARREMKEELGIKGCELRHLYCYLFSNHLESELVTAYSCVYEGKSVFNREEIDEVAFWDIPSIKKNLGRNIFSGHFEKEIRHYLGMEND